MIDFLRNIDHRGAALLGALSLAAGCLADDAQELEGTGADTTHGSDATGVGLDVDVLALQDADADEPQRASNTYFYDLAEYMAPSCSTPVNLVFPNVHEIRRYVPVGVRHGAAAWIYAKDADKGFEEYTADPMWIRLWSDTTWAYEHATAPGNFCDETCGTQGVTTPCHHEWDTSAPPQQYAYLAPREASDTGLGAKFMPRYIPRDDRPYTYSGTSYLHAKKRGDCTSCPGNDSWHASASTPVTITAMVRHVPSYKGWNDLIMKVTTHGSGRGDRFWFARGHGFVGFEQLSQNSADMTSTDPALAPVGHVSFASGSNGPGSAFPGAQRACFGLAQGENCGAWQPPAAIPLGQWIRIRARANDRLVSADNFGKNPLIANRVTAGDWEKFMVVDQGAGNVALIANANQKFVCADNFGNNSLIANRPGPGAGQWEVYRWIDLGNHDFALQSASNGKYVTAENAGNSPLIANRAEVGAWERFHWE